ncbi:hypothetical protein LOTGIDRAFT_131489, partial [Lottia gigantea]
WRYYTFTFKTEDDTAQLDVVKQNGHLMKSVSIVLDQKEKFNRENACEVLNILSNLGNQRVSILILKFVGENPLFFSGIEFVKALKSFFSAKNQDDDTGSLLEVDVGCLWVDLDKEFLEILSSHHKNLESLNIQTEIMISKVHPAYIMNLLDNCKRLKNLSLFYINLSDEVLEKLVEEGRDPFDHLSIKCRHQDNYSNIISKSSWKTLTEKWPNLKVEIIFDPNFSQDKFSQILCPEIPVNDVNLEMYSDVSKELNFIAENYPRTLENLTVYAEPSKYVEESLMAIARNCQKLSSLYVYCTISEDVTEQILELYPGLRESKQYHFG